MNLSFPSRFETSPRPDQTFSQKFESENSVAKRFCTIFNSSIDGLVGSEAVKCPVGYNIAPRLAASFNFSKKSPTKGEFPDKQSDGQTFKQTDIQTMAMLLIRSFVCMFYSRSSNTGRSSWLALKWYNRTDNTNWEKSFFNIEIR